MTRQSLPSWAVLIRDEMDDTESALKLIHSLARLKPIIEQVVSYPGRSNTSKANERKKFQKILKQATSFQESIATIDSDTDFIRAKVKAEDIQGVHQSGVRPNSGQSARDTN